MSKQESLNNFYRAVLASLDILVGEDDALSTNIGNPLLIDGKRVYLPTNEVLKNFNTDMVGFHPLCESVFEGLSDVMTALRVLSMQHISDMMLVTMYALVKTAADANATPTKNDKKTEKKATVPAAQLDIVSKLAGADDKTVHVLEQLSNVISVDTANRIVTLSLRHSALDDKEESSVNTRSCHVTFPMLDELRKDGTTSVFGVKMRKKDIAILTAAFNIVLPDSDVVGKYSTGVSSSTAPYFKAFIRTHLNLLMVASETTSKFKDIVDKFSSGKHLNLDVKVAEAIINGLENMRDFASAVRPLPYNMGNKVIENAQSAKEEVVGSILNRANDIANVVSKQTHHDANNPPPTREEPQRRLGRADAGERRIDYTGERGPIARHNPPRRGFGYRDRQDDYDRGGLRGRTLGGRDDRRRDDRRGSGSDWRNAQRHNTPW